MDKNEKGIKLVNSVLIQRSVEDVFDKGSFQRNEVKNLANIKAALEL
ncbi:MAG: hypothetical protein R6V73_01525 [Anaerolineales bacterium]|jgi:hypothetical protein